MRGAAILAISSCLVAAVSLAVTVVPGQAEQQQVADDATILISAIAAIGQDSHTTHRSGERAQRASDGKRATRAGLNAAAAAAGLDATAAATGLEAAAGAGKRPEQARSTAAGTFDLVVRSLPGQRSRTADCS